MNDMLSFREIEFSDEECLEGMLVTVTLQDGSKQYAPLRNLDFSVGHITIRERHVRQ
jgi:hypothetical protein